MPKITLSPSNQSYEIDSKTSLFDGLTSQGVYIKSTCGGVGSCGECKIKIVSGEDNLNGPSFEELQKLGNVFHITRERLSCQCFIIGDVRIDLSEHDQERDEKRRQERTTNLSKVKRRTKDELSQKVQSDPAPKEKKEDQQWYRHWEKESSPDSPKRLGGGRRVRPFKTEDDDSEEN